MRKRLIPLSVVLVATFFFAGISHAQNAVFLEEAPRVSERVAPEYPALAREARVQGVVLLEVTVDPSGIVIEVRERKGLPIGMTDSAVRAVRQWKFEPTLVDEKPVAARFFVRVVFELDEEEVAARVGETLPLAQVPEGIFLELSKVPESSVAPAPQIVSHATRSRWR